jgi:hypothetical protein
VKCSSVHCLLVGALLAAPATAAGTERLDYRWSLGGFFGTLARVFFPGHGEGTLTTRTDDGHNTQVELDITSPEGAEEGEFWRYGSEIDPTTGRTLRAWSSYRFRGDSSREESDLAEVAVIDVASGILLLRRSPPSEPLELRIWNDGKVYPVVILPRGQVQRAFAGRTHIARHFAIRPRRVPNERLWKGSMDIYLLNDEASTPVEISLERRMARVRLMLEEGS